MPIKETLQGISSPKEANHAYIACLTENYMVAIGCMGDFFGNIETVRQIAGSHLARPGMDTHEVEVVFQWIPQCPD